MSAANGASNIDTDLYSRQIGAFGLETMTKLTKLKVLISGLNGLGAETAKNLILAGPNEVCLHDDRKATIQDLASNFYLTEEDVKLGRSRADACTPRLAELNNYVRTSVFEGELTSSKLSQFHVVIVCDMARKQMIAINDVCRSQDPPIAFIAMDAFGLACSLFVDFGAEFTIFDKDGNPPKSAIIEGITQENPGTVHLHQDKLNPFSDSDFVVFKEVQGMSELNTHEPIKVSSTTKYSFNICDTSAMSPYLRDGIVEQVKMPTKVEFKTMAECVLRPVAGGEQALAVADWGKFGRSEQLHFAIQSVYEYRDLHHCLPSPRSDDAVTECLSIARRLNAEAQEMSKSDASDISQWRSAPVEEIEEIVVKNVVMYASCQICPIAAFLGGIVAQEVVKFTGKYTPFRQWFYFDQFECLLKETPMDTAPQNSRYDHQICIWGDAFQRRLGALKIFLVGAGALGCEFLKSLALMGCCTATAGGALTVTDMDHIEVSNLNRQFLFRSSHVGSSKSKTAAIAAQGMNPALNVTASEVRVGVETEDDFDDDFWTGLDIVINALDNIQSRQYIDSRCVWYHKPLLESGTLGTKANMQVVLPKMTQSYGDSHDPPEDSIPLCTLRHFPNQIEHTIEWARDAFQGLFCGGPREAAAFMGNVEEFLGRLGSEGTVSTQRERLQTIHALLTTMKDGASYEICVENAVKLFTNYFDFQVAQLLHTFPIGHVTTTGMPFWSGPKRAPQVLHFSAEDPLHLAFVFSAANLMAFNLGIPMERDIQVAKRIAEKTRVEQFVAQEVRIKVDEKDSTVEGASDDDMVKEKLTAELIEMVSSLRVAKTTEIHPVEFEKDDDKNFHIAFIWACANLRARNYKIVECDQHKTKMIAGKIVPAIATTTAMVTGLVAMELLKTVNYGERVLEDFKNAFVNMGLPLFVLSEPSPPIQTKDKEYDAIIGGPVRARPNGFTPWDVLEYNIPNATLGQLIKAIEEEQKVEVSILSVGNSCLFNSFLKSHKERLTQQVLELVVKITKQPLPKNRRYVAVEASSSDEDGTDVMLPTIKLNF